MTVLRLVALAGNGVDDALAAIAGAVLARRERDAYAEVALADVERAARALALAGIRAEPCQVDLAPAPGLVLAVGRDLAPLPGEAVPLDVVHVRRLDPAEATREVMSRRWYGLLPPTAAARERCRSLLRGQEVTLAWRRRAWLRHSALRSGEVRRSLRPVVFDRGAAGADLSLAPRISSRDGALGRWLFA